MKKLYAAIFFFVALLLLFCIYTTKKTDKKNLTSMLHTAFWMAFVAAFSHVFIAITQNIVVATLAYSVFYSCINWILLALLRFCISYTGLSRHLNKDYKVLPRLGVLLSALDSLVLLSNYFTSAAFTCKAILWKDWHEYFITEKCFYFHFHIACSYLLAAAIFFVLVFKIVRCPPVYWSRYLTVLVCFLITIGWDAFFVLNRHPVDFSIIGYAVAAVAILYFTMIYKPNYLINKILGHIEDNSEDMLVFFDIDGNCIYANTSALRSFGYRVTNLDEFQNVVSDWLADKGFEANTPSFSAMCSKVINGKTYHFEFTYHTLYDHGVVEGSFFHIRDCTKEVNSYNEAYYKAAHDSLTGMYNLEYFSETVSGVLKMDPSGWYVIVTDIKGFKFINDLFGKQTGDKVLVYYADLLRRSSAPNNVYGRVANDRFAIFTKNVEEAKKTFSNIGPELGALIRNSNFPIVIHAGIYPVTNPAMSVMSMVDRALLALGTVKDSYEVFIATYDESLRDKRLWENKIIGELDGALASGQFEMYLQPQTDRDLKLCGAEALIRWNHPTEGLLPPAWFIETFENDGLIIKIDYFIWQEACKTLQRWKRMGLDDLYISVNISPRDFYYVDVYKTFVDLVKQYDINPACLKLELTETAMITDSERRFVLIDRLHAAGFQVEMDDFGSGYSSLNMLKDIRVDVLKIDMLFLYKAKDVERSRIIIKQVVVLARELGMTVVIEGVETEEQLKFLLETGCDIFQGYYFSKPIPCAAFEEKYFKTDK